MQVQKSLDKLLIGNIQYKVKQGRIRQKLQFDIIIMITIGISWFTWGWRGILIWLRMMHWTRHPGPLMKRRQILARLIIISPSLFYSSLFLSIGIRTYCLLLLSGPGPPLLWAPLRITRPGLVSGSGTDRDPLWLLSILWCSDNLDPGPGLAAATNWLTSRAKIAAKRREGKMIKFLIKNIIINILF